MRTVDGIKIVFLCFMTVSMVDMADSLRKVLRLMEYQQPVSISSNDVINVNDTDTIKTPSFMNKSPKDGLRDALHYYGVHHPDIVYAQSVLETGYFRSELCRNKNNLFGLYDSAHRRYYSFNHWSESVKAYKDKVQYKYDSEKHPTYYAFLSDIGYASDKKYNKRLKQILNKE